MVTLRSHVRLCVLLICSFNILAAEEPANLAGSKAPPVITAGTSGEKVRFSAAAGICQMRLQLVAPSGEVVMDSSWKEGNVLDWPVEPDAQPLLSGSYRGVVMAKDLAGEVTEREVTISVQAGQLSIERRDGSEGITVIGSDGSGPAIMLLAHDGANGSLVSTSGDLTFRFGDFLAAKESERMRLTRDGSLGIGTGKPQAPLDVNGLIRTSEGVMFPDGTILASAAGLPGELQEDGTIRQPPTARTVVMDGPSQVASRTAGKLHSTPRPNAVPDYQFKVDTTGVHIGTTSAFGLDVAGDVTLSSNLALPVTTSRDAGVIALGNYRFAHAYGPNNVFLGTNAGNFTTTGCCNTASGVSALLGNTTGCCNTASGYFALEGNTAGYSNTASGFYALSGNTTGYYNTASGDGALLLNTEGCCNTAAGYQALFNNTTGYNNTAIGNLALQNNSTGFYNIGIGYGAGASLTTGSYNIDIGSSGNAGESNTTRIGGFFQQRTFISGISGVTTAGAAVPVVVDANGQLGTVSSSRRYKFDIAGMDDATDDVMHLRPVTFRYSAHGDHAPLQYGLIAEEVAQVYPEMVTRNENGEPEAVMYQFLAPMLLNEVQKQHRTIEMQQETIDMLTARLEEMGERLEALERSSRR